MAINELGMRVGAAHNQASTIAAALIQAGTFPATDHRVIADYVGDLAGELLTKMNDAQDGSTTAAVSAAFAGTTVINDAVTTVATVPAQTSVSAPTYAPTQAPASGGYNTTFSGSKKPLVIAEHPELDAWLVAQTKALGVDRVWDNRGKPEYVAAVAKLAADPKAKTPPPFRSATDGITQGFWPVTPK